MQKPFQLSDDMLREIDEQVTTAIKQERLPLLETREHTHGPFEDVAIMAQALKRTFRTATGWNHLSDIEREAMDMIASKFSRILSGKSMERQHWEDVTGYAKLIEEKCI